MPKVYITLEQKRQAEFDRQNRLENALLGSEIKTAMKQNKIRYPELCQKADVSNGTLSKAINNPQELNLSRLRKICYCAGLKLKVEVEPI